MGCDLAGRRTSLGQDLTGTANDLTLGFAYNPAGQIASTTRSNTAYSWTGAYNVTRSYTTNNLNQYTVAGPLALPYDAKGNVTASGSDSYSSENLMLTGPNGAALVYDPLLRLAQVSNATTVASRFLYDGQSIIGQATGSGTFDRRYVLVPGSDEVLVEYKINAGTRNWKLADERGSRGSIIRRSTINFIPWNNSATSPSSTREPPTPIARSEDKASDRLARSCQLVVAPNAIGCRS